MRQAQTTTVGGEPAHENISNDVAGARARLERQGRDGLPGRDELPRFLVDGNGRALASGHDLGVVGNDSTFQNPERKGSGSRRTVEGFGESTCVLTKKRSGRELYNRDCREKQRAQASPMELWRG